MKTKSVEAGQRLRKQAEARVREDIHLSEDPLSPEQITRELHELRVHKVELELQNQELLQTQHELEVSQSSYFDMYELAPVGYLSLSDQGLIQRANLTAANLLGVERQKLINRLISDFIYREDQDTYYLNQRQLLKTNDLRDMEIRMVRSDAKPVWMQFQVSKENTCTLLLTFNNITKRKQAEVELAESQSLLHGILDSTSDLIFSVDICDRSFPLRSFNYSFYEYFLNKFGIRAEIGMCTEDLLPTDEYVQRWKDYFKRTLVEGHFITEYTAYGGSKTLELNFHLLYNNGKVFGISVFGKDITERKRLEAERLQAVETLKQSVALLNRTQLTTHIGSWEWIVSSQTAIWSAETYRLHGFEPGMHFSGTNAVAESLKCYLPEDRSMLQERFLCCVEQGKPYDLELPFTNVLGQQMWVRTFAEPVVENGQVVRVVGFIMDITERKLAEETQRKSEDRHRTILQTALDGFWIVDVHGRLVEVNDTYCRMSGYSSQELLTMTISDLEAIENTEEVANHIIKVIEMGRGRFESQHRRKDGTLIDVELSIQYRPDEDGCFVVFLRDITEQKKVEKDKRILEQQLLQAQKMEVIGQLAGGVAHDFNNKLMAILGFAELSKIEIHDSEKVLNYLDVIRSAAEQSRDITFRLLAFSRQQAISPQSLAANKVITESLKSLSRLIGEHISISFQPFDKLWNIRMDPVQLDQVVMNMVINARDAMPDGGSLAIETRNITLDSGSCSSTVVAVPGDYVIVTFSDTGTGIDKETLTHIFEPFFTTKEVGKGTGLGLATIHGIIYQNNGFIDVTSNVGHGTEFKVYIPRFSEPEKEPITKADTATMGSCSILLVEDEDAVRNVISLFLKKTGYTVYEAATPSAALELARDLSIQIDLVLTDYVMPEMNGKAMMEQILKLRPKTLCIYASGFSPEYVQLSKEAILIQKPYDLLKLSGILKRVISGIEEQ